MHEIYCQLRDKCGVKDADVVRETGITKSTFSDWKNGRSKPKNDKLQKIADFFGVTVDYLMTGKEEVKKKEISIEPIESRDIGKRLDEILRDMDARHEGPLYADGQKLDETQQRLLAYQIRVALQQVKILKGDEEADHLMPVAAHERTDIDSTEEARQHDEDLMNDDDLWK